MKRIKYSNGSEVRLHGDVAGLHASTKPGTFSVTPAGPQVNTGTKNIRATLRKDVQQVVAQDKKGRHWSATKTPDRTSVGVQSKKAGLNLSKDNVNLRVGNVSVNTGKGGTNITAHKNIGATDTSLTVGRTPRGKKYIQANLNNPTGRR